MDAPGDPWVQASEGPRAPLGEACLGEACVLESLGEGPSSCGAHPGVAHEAHEGHEVHGDLVGGGQSWALVRAESWTGIQTGWTNKWHHDHPSPIAYGKNVTSFKIPLTWFKACLVGKVTTGHCP